MSDGRHLAHFATFLFAVSASYFVCLRFAGRAPAWMATALFATQPLLVGNGFINQKDTPFMALFLATLVVGLAAGDRLSRASSQEVVSAIPASGLPASGFWKEPVLEWRASSRRRRGLLAFVAAASLLVALDLACTGSIHHLAERWLDAAYLRTAPAVPQ